MFNEGKTDLKNALPIIKTSLREGGGAKELVVKYYHLVLLFLLIVGVAVVAALLYSIYRADIRPLRADINIKNVDLLSRQADLEKLKSMKVDYESLEAAGQRIVDILPAEKDISSLILQLENIALKNNLKFTALNIADKQSGAASNIAKVDKYKKISLSVNLSGGNYFTLKDYLFDIEQNLRLLDIESINYNPETASYSLGMTAYYQDENYGGGSKKQ